jgi:peptidoglycan/xylan/chitin deacetylase (PgdA/CDA1 family)
MEHSVFLTFDDGPHPQGTPYVLDLLKQYDCKATFFCVGENIEKYPETFEQILKEGHLVGNHGYLHLNGWKTSLKNYVTNALKAQNIYPFKLFRPPYGKIGLRQYLKLKKIYQIVFWNILSYDFNPNLNTELLLKRLKKRTKPKSIIVFHDSLKAKEQLQKILPAYLEYLKSVGLTSRKLTKL